MSKITGLRAMIFRSNMGDCSNRGPSGQAGNDGVLVVDDEVLGPVEFEAGDFERWNYFPVRLVHRQIGGEPYVHAVPLVCEEWPGSERYEGHTMFGGTFIYTSDSRLRDISPYPIPLHDRVED